MTYTCELYLLTWHTRSISMYWEGRAVALALAASRPLSPLLEGPSGFIASDGPGNEDGGAVDGAACTGGLL